MHFNIAYTVIHAEPINLTFKRRAIGLI